MKERKTAMENVITQIRREITDGEVLPDSVLAVGYRMGLERALMIVRAELLEDGRG